MEMLLRKQELNLVAIKIQNYSLSTGIFKQPDMPFPSRLMLKKKKKRKSIKLIVSLCTLLIQIVTHIL